MSIHIHSGQQLIQGDKQKQIIERIQQRIGSFQDDLIIIFENLIPPPKSTISAQLNKEAQVYVLSSDIEDSFEKLNMLSLPEGHIITILSDSCLLYYLSLPKVLSEFLQEHHIDSESAVMYLRLLLDEAIKNAIEHGNLDLSIVKDGFIEGSEDFEDYLAIIQDRLMDPRWGKKKVILQIHQENDKLICCIEDEGLGFDWEDVLQKSESVHHGRGLKLVQQIAEDIKFENNGRKHSFSIKLSN